MAKRASDKRLLEFTNEVRACGGANVQEALMPGIPGIKNKCLIANNLNFNCSVSYQARALFSHGWFMFIPNGERIVNKLVKELGLKKRGLHSVWLPADIGLAAEDFDNAADTCHVIAIYGANNPTEYSTLKSMWKYLPENTKNKLPQKYKTKNGNLIEYSKLPPK